MNLPEISGKIWIGGTPATSEQLKGKVVLVDFWTYSCVNCRRTIPYLKTWWEEYRNENFIVVGIHAPEFEFERNPANVENAMKEMGITWPVILDNEHVNWDRFANKYWPAKYLADESGKIVYTHFGEGNYEETEQKIRELLGLEYMASARSLDDDGRGKVCYPATPETYCGYLRGDVGNELSYTEEAEDDYKKTEEVAGEGKIYLEGKFFAASEYVESRGEGATLSIPFSATEVNLVLESPSKGNVITDLLLNGAPLSKDVRGKDIDEESRLIISGAKMYNLLKSKKGIEGVLSLRASKGNFRAYAFTFSGCEE